MEKIDVVRTAGDAFARPSDGGWARRTAAVLESDCCRSHDGRRGVDIRSISCGRGSLVSAWWRHAIRQFGTKNDSVPPKFRPSAVEPQAIALPTKIATSPAGMPLK